MVSKKIVLSLLTIFFIGAATAGTWASISSAAPQISASTSAGNIVISLDDASWNFPQADLLPGEETIASATITNTGSRDGNLVVTPTFSAPAGLTPEYYISTNGVDYTPIASGVSYPLGVVSAGSESSTTVSVKIVIPASSEYNDAGAITANMICVLNQ